MPRLRIWVTVLAMTASWVVVGVAAADPCPWVGSTATPDSRAAQVLAAMTFDEKLHMVRGSLTDPAGIVGPIYAGLIREIPRLCVPQLGFADGPAGTGGGLTGVTQLPAPIALGASWNESLAASFGDVIAAEHAGKGANVVLAPALDILRDPRAGRGFESFGEDPLLMSRLGVAEVRAIQARGQIAQPKHFAGYTQETLRDTEPGNAVIDERTLHEIYFPPFEAVVTQADAASIMCSYNFLNGSQACSNPYLLNQVLKGQWGFRGFVTSDWYAMHSSAGAANAGLDVQMPTDCYFGAALKRAIDEGRVPQSRLDDMAFRVLRSMFAVGLFDRPASGSPGAVVTTPAHVSVARAVATEGMVLLKNSGGVLPLDGSETIALIGAGAGDGALTGGLGSSAVIPSDVVTPLEGFAARGASVVHHDGVDPVRAAAVARDADVAIVFARLLQGEFKDRPSLELFPTDTATIEAVAAANPRTVVVLNTGGPVTMPWLDRVAGVLQAWYPGQQYGHALADVVFGDADASGRLPVTFPKRLSDVPAFDPVRFPGGVHSEGLAVGYRWYDRNGIEPLFAFGHGLSYTTFSYSNLAVSDASTSDGSVTVTSDVTNTGSRAGSEVAQIYLSYPAAAGEPPRVLRGFRKVALQPGQSAQVSFELDARSFAIFDAGARRWVASPGTFGVHVGSSSRNLTLSASVALTATLTPGAPVPLPPAAPTDSALDVARDTLLCPKDSFAPYVNGGLSFTGFPPPREALGYPVP